MATIVSNAVSGGQVHEVGIADVIERRRDVHAYRPEPVDRTEIRQLLDSAVHAPTALNFEPWAFVVVEDRALLDRLSERAKAEAFAPPTTSDFNIFYDARTLIVICAKPLGPNVTADCWRAGENLMLAACALSLGTCRIDAALLALRQSDVKRELGIPDGIEAVMAIVVGHPRSEPPPASPNAPEILRWSVAES
ncbi:MAG: nitroreductase family protein [Gemmatimonadaceae bacterium]